MANQRISELTQITVSTMDLADLLLISDVNAHQSKKLTLGDLSIFLLAKGLLTGSFYGTASYAISAATASYVGQQQSSSYALTASWAQNVITASYALTTNTCSYAITSSYIATASYALTFFAQSGFTASFAGNAQTASYLLYDPSVPSGNGTASFALMALSMSTPQISSSYATTASYTSYADVAATAPIAAAVISCLNLPK